MMGRNAAEQISALNVTWISILIITVFVCQALYEIIKFHDKEKTKRWLQIFWVLAITDIVWSATKTLQVFSVISFTTYQAALQFILPAALMGKAALVMIIIDAARKATQEYKASIDGDQPPV